MNGTLSFSQKMKIPRSSRPCNRFLHLLDSAKGARRFRARYCHTSRTISGSVNSSRLSTKLFSHAGAVNLVRLKVIGMICSDFARNSIQPYSTKAIVRAQTMKRFREGVVFPDVGSFSLLKAMPFRGFLSSAHTLAVEGAALP